MCSFNLYAAQGGVMKIVIIILLVFIALPAQAQIFKSQGANGDLHFTDRFNKVPIGNKLVSTTPKIPNKSKTPLINHRSSNFYAPRVIILEITPFISPSIKSYCYRNAGDGYSLKEACVHRELAGQVFFRANFIPGEIRQYCNSLVSESWARMKTCAINEMRSKSYLGQNKKVNRRQVGQSKTYVRRNLN